MSSPSSSSFNSIKRLFSRSFVVDGIIMQMHRIYFWFATVHFRNEIIDKACINLSDSELTFDSMIMIQCSVTLCSVLGDLFLDDFVASLNSHRQLQVIAIDDHRRNERIHLIYAPCSNATKANVISMVMCVCCPHQCNWSLLTGKLQMFSILILFRFVHLKLHNFKKNNNCAIAIFCLDLCRLRQNEHDVLLFNLTLVMNFAGSFFRCVCGLNEMKMYLEELRRTLSAQTYNWNWTF